MKKIVVYCDRWQDGGVESFLIHQFRHWDKTKLHVTLVTAEKTTKIHDSTLLTMGIRHIVLLDAPQPPISRILKSLFRCYRYFRHHPCDIAYFHLTNGVPMLYAGFAKWGGISKRIIHSHCSGLESSGTKPLKLAAHFIAKYIFSGFATEFWSCSRQAAAFLFPRTKARIARFIPNAIDTRRFAFSKKERSNLRLRLACEDCFLVGHIGRCVPIKNQAFLLDVLVLLLKKRADARLLFVGDGPLLSKLEEKAKRLGVLHACFFYGFSDEIPSLLSAMDAFCLPSKEEGLGIAAIEAQANGLPCFLSDTVPQEATLLPQTRYLPIGRGAEKTWAEALSVSTLTERDMGWEIVQSKGFDILGCAQNVQALLLEE